MQLPQVSSADRPLDWRGQEPSLDAVSVEAVLNFSALRAASSRVDAATRDPQNMWMYRTDDIDVPSSLVAERTMAEAALDREQEESEQTVKKGKKKGKKQSKKKKSGAEQEQTLLLGATDDAIAAMEEGRGGGDVGSREAELLEEQAAFLEERTPLLARPFGLSDGAYSDDNADEGDAKSEKKPKKKNAKKRKKKAAAGAAADGSDVEDTTNDPDPAQKQPSSPSDVTQRIVANIDRLVSTENKTKEEFMNGTAII